MTESKVKIEFNPGCFDDFEGTQEELDEIVAEITTMFENGVAEAEAREVDLDELIETDPDVAEKIFEALHRLDGNGNEPVTRNLQ